MKKIINISAIILLLAMGSFYVFLPRNNTKAQPNKQITTQTSANNNVSNNTTSTPIKTTINTSQQNNNVNNDPSSLSIDEVAKHSSTSDCYLAINNNVYDVSSYINKHPGGKANITSRCGTEVSGVFAQIHSNRAWDLLAKYKIATLKN